MGLGGLALCLCTAIGACAGPKAGSDGIPRRACDIRVWYRPPSPAAKVELVASWLDWKRPGIDLPARREDGWRAFSASVPPGEHRYALVVDGEWIANPYVPTTDEVDGREVTWVEVDACEAPRVEIVSATATAAGDATVEARFLALPRGAPLDPAAAQLRERRPDGTLGDPRTPAVADPTTGVVRFAVAGLAPGKHTFVLEAQDGDGRPAEPKPASVWVEAEPFDLHDAILYQVVLDRFRGRGGAPLASPSPPSARAGGTLDGFRAYMATGALEAMGVNTLWLSPLYLNPDGEFPGNDGRLYSSYHGYWPKETRRTDPRVATEAELDAFMAEAHARNLRVLFDVVPNHVHAEHSYFRERPTDAGFNIASPPCICGQGACDWGRYIQTCWFAPYMPDLDWRDPATARRAVDDVTFWLDRFDADGVRIDAVPMMPRAATRRIVARLRERFEHPGNPLMLLGENFTGPDGYATLRYHLGPYGLDSQFHFPLMWALRAAIAHGGQGLDAVADAVRIGEESWAGSGAVMGTFIGNHDVTRFASEASGDASGDGWEPAPQPTDAVVYKRQGLALGLVFTLPGAPVVYYGDEVGLAGRGDPDSRRVLPAESELTAPQRELRGLVEKLGRLRRCEPALRRGTYRLLSATTERYVFARELGDRAAYVVAQREASAAAPLPIPPGRYVEALSGRTAALPDELTSAPGAPFSVGVYLPEASPCAPSPP